LSVLYSYVIADETDDARGSTLFFKQRLLFYIRGLQLAARGPNLAREG